MTIDEHIKSWYVQWLYIECLYSKYASQYHLTRATMTALDEIYHHQEGCSQKGICQVLSLPKQTVSSLMSNLENKGLVTKQKCPEDGRSYYYFLTDEGTILCSKIIQELDEIEANAFKQLSEEDLENFTRINSKLTKLIEMGMRGGNNNGN